MIPNEAESPAVHSGGAHVPEIREAPTRSRPRLRLRWINPDGAGLTARWVPEH